MLPGAALAGAVLAALAQPHGVRLELDTNHFAKRLSFFFYVHMDLFEEVAKFRAGRRIWHGC